MTLTSDKSSGGSYLRNVVTLTGGNAIAQVITISLVPVITRIYSPDEFGIYSMAIAIAGGLSAVAPLRYNAAILLPEVELDADALAIAASGLVLIMTILTFFFFLMVNQFNWLGFDVRVSSLMLWFVPASLFLGGNYLVITSLLVRKSAFKVLAVTSIGAATADRSAAIAIGILSSAQAMGLALGKLSGQFVMLVFSIVSLHYLARRVLDKKVHKRIPVLLSRYRRFATYSWVTLIRQLNVQAPVLIIGVMFSPVVAGLFALGRRVILEPINVLGDAVAKAFFHKAAHEYRQGLEIGGMCRRLSEALTAFIVPPSVMFVGVAPDVFAVIFGARWQEAGVYVQLLTPFFVVLMLIRPLSVLFDLLEKQREAAIYEAIVLLFSMAALIGGYLLGNPLLTVGLLSMVWTILACARIVWLLALVDVHPFVWPSVLVKWVLYGMAWSIPLLVCKYHLQVTEWVLASTTFLWIAIYAAWYMRFSEKGKLIMLALGKQN